MSVGHGRGGALRTTLVLFLFSIVATRALSGFSVRSQAALSSHEVENAEGGNERRFTEAAALVYSIVEAKKESDPKFAGLGTMALSYADDLQNVRGDLAVDKDTYGRYISIPMSVLRSMRKLGRAYRQREHIAAVEAYVLVHLSPISMDSSAVDGSSPSQLRELHKRAGTLSTASLGEAIWTKIAKAAFQRRQRWFRAHGTLPLHESKPLQPMGEEG